MADDGAFLAARIDHAFLRVNSQADVASLRQVADETLKYGLRCLCLPPVLAGTVKRHFPAVRVSAVIAYPLGMETIGAKIFAIQEMVELGVEEVDVVYDLFALANGNWAKLREEAQRLGKYTADANVFHKAIIETPILNEEQIRCAAEILLESKIDCIKTSTGYEREPTSLDHVKLLRKVVGARKQIKASGGIRSFYNMRAMLDSGADIIGTSNPVQILEEAGTLSPS